MRRRRRLGRQVPQLHAQVVRRRRQHIRRRGVEADQVDLIRVRRERSRGLVRGLLETCLYKTSSFLIVLIPSGSLSYISLVYGTSLSYTKRLLGRYRIAHDSNCRKGLALSSKPWHEIVAFAVLRNSIQEQKDIII